MPNEWLVDYPGAIKLPAHPSNFYTPENHGGVANKPLGWVLHTPEEPADAYPSTPYYFQTPGIQASTHYFAAYTGEIWQMVPERCAAIANGVKGKPYPSWASPSTSLNWQSLNVEIEGYGHSIHQTLIPGNAQWQGLLSLIRSRAAFYHIPLDREHIIGHYQVAFDRSDPGALFPWDALIRDLGSGDDMFVRFNGVTPLSGKTYGAGTNYFVSLFFDFPTLPKNAKAVELDVRIEPNTSGKVVWKDGNKRDFADEVNRYKPQSIVKVIPASDGRIFFDVFDAPVKFSVIGIVGFWV